VAGPLSPPHWQTNPSLFFSISLIFGALTVGTGIIGVILGAKASSTYKKVNPRAEPLICASSLLAAAPCIYLALILAPITLLGCYVSEGPSEVGVGWAGNSCFAQAHTVPIFTDIVSITPSRGSFVIPILQM